MSMTHNRNGADKEEAVGKDGKRKISAYSDVPNDMFYCHLCAKHMWDSTSFENHLKGRTHQVRESMSSRHAIDLKIFLSNFR
jgi:Zinc-finger double-stranded RNA-binding